jgi:hypothetical protein
MGIKEDAEQAKKSLAVLVDGLINKADEKLKGLIHQAEESVDEHKPEVADAIAGKIHDFQLLLRRAEHRIRKNHGTDAKKSAAGKKLVPPQPMKDPHHKI